MAGEESGIDPVASMSVSSLLNPLEFSVRKGKKGSKAKLKHGPISSPSNSSNSSLERVIFSPSKQNPDKKHCPKPILKSRSISSPFGSCNSSINYSHTKSKENGVSEGGREGLQRG
ncbi:hypothetical protein GBA52_003060 [Prunus armeniaca]|nr:hypothetical protein GBA52_003060 [Prunus armeniaca]